MTETAKSSGDPDPFGHIFRLIVFIGRCFGIRYVEWLNKLHMRARYS